MIRSLGLSLLNPVEVEFTTEIAESAEMRSVFPAGSAVKRLKKRGEMKKWDCWKV